LFFISLKAAITSTGLVFPVAFWTAGSCNLLASLAWFGVGIAYVESHKDVVKLKVVSRWIHMSGHSNAYLLIANGEFALGLLVGIGKSLELLDRLALQDLNAELDVALGVLVTRLQQIRQQIYKPDSVISFSLRRPWCHRAEKQESRSKPCAFPVRCLRRNDHSLLLYQLLIHRICGSSKLAADEKSVSGENDLLVAILEQEANAVLGVARGVQSLDLDVTNVEGLAVCRCLGHLFAVSSTNDGEGVGFQLVDCQSYSFSSEDEKFSTHHLNITAGMIVVAAIR
jgi:hypothetical protein